MIRNELIIKEAFLSGLTWSDAEKLFSINRNYLFDDLKKFFSGKPSGESRMEKVLKKIKQNERKEDQKA